MVRLIRLAAVRQPALEHNPRRLAVLAAVLAVVRHLAMIVGVAVTVVVVAVAKEREMLVTKRPALVRKEITVEPVAATTKAVAVAVAVVRLVATDQQAQRAAMVAQVTMRPHSEVKVPQQHFTLVAAAVAVLVVAPVVRVVAVIVVWRVLQTLVAAAVAIARLGALDKRAVPALS